MAYSKKDRIRSKKRMNRVRYALKKGEIPRVVVFRSHKHIYGQIIDDIMQKTIVSFNSKQTDTDGDKMTVAHSVGEALGALAKKEGVDRVVFDRGRYLFHGRVKAFAEGLQKSGVTI